MTLYILGNGFDLAHKLPTAYWDFRTYLNSAHPEFLEAFEEHYDIYPSMSDEAKKEYLWNKVLDYCEQTLDVNPENGEAYWIMELAEKYHLTVIEDAAQGIMSTYKGKALGTFGDFGCYSFHETKNYSMGEGGALLIRDEKNVENAEIVREKGTNRSKFFRGQIDKYTWVEAGSSYLPSELNAAYLYAQLEVADKINEKRLSIWNRYWDGLGKLADEEKIVRPTVPEGCVHNAHMFYLKARNLEERTALISYLKEQGIQAVFHYIPLHTAPAGKRYGIFAGEDRYTTSESERLVRLPLFYNLTLEQVDDIIDRINAFYEER